MFIFWAVFRWLLYLIFFQDVNHDAQVWQWVYFSINEVQPSVYSWLLPALGLQKASPEPGKKATAKILSSLNDLLLQKTYLVGERISQADIALSTTLLPIYLDILGPESRKPYVHVNRWLATCVNQPEFIKVLGKVEFSSQDGAKKAKK